MDLVTFIEEIFNGKLRFLCGVNKILTKYQPIKLNVLYIVVCNTLSVRKTLHTFCNFFLILKRKIHYPIKLKLNGNVKKGSCILKN